MRKTTVAVLVTILVLTLCFAAGAMAWGPHVEGEYVGYGYVGVLMPILSVLCAFFAGRATELFLQSDR